MCIRDLSPPYGAWGTACSAAGIPARSLRERPIEIHFAPRILAIVRRGRCRKHPMYLAIDIGQKLPASLRHILLRRAAGVPRRERNCELSRETPNIGIGQAFQHDHILLAIFSDDAPLIVRLAYTDELMDGDRLG